MSTEHRAQSTEHLIAPVIIEIRPSIVLSGEIGLFAAVDLKLNSIVGEAAKFDEKFHPWADFDVLDAVTQRKIRQYCIQTADGFFTPDDFHWLPVPWNMNHSCDPNVGFDGADNFVTTRDVKKGEELCWDYGMGISFSKFELACRCSSANCRKIVTGNDWKDETYRAPRIGYFSRNLLRDVGLSGL